MQDSPLSPDPVPPPLPPATPPSTRDANPGVVIAPAEPIRRPARRAPSTHNPFLTVSRVLFLLALLLILQYVVPYLLERYHYAITRGQQQAKYEIATVGLKEMPLDSLSKAYQMVSQQVGPSVVHINVRSVHEQEVPTEFAQLFGPQRRELRGQGSGVIVDPQGYIVTNYHVVFGARDIIVSISD